MLIFKPISSGTTIQYFFAFGVSEVFDITQIGITQNEASGDIGKNSFYLLEFYDTFDSRKQTKIFQTYLISLKNTTFTKYDVNLTTNKELLNWYVPETKIDTLLSISGNTSNNITLYCKMSFYSAKDGKFYYFINALLRNFLSEEKNYFTAHLNLTNKTYTIDDTIYPKQITDNVDYVNKQQNNVNPMIINKPTYPIGTSTVISGGTIVYI